MKIIGQTFANAKSKVTRSVDDAVHSAEENNKIFNKIKRIKERRGKRERERTTIYTSSLSNIKRNRDRNVRAHFYKREKPVRACISVCVCVYVYQ